MKQYKLSINAKKRLTAGTLMLGVVGYAFAAAAIFFRPNIAVEVFLYAMGGLLAILGLSGIVGALSSAGKQRILRFILGAANLALCFFSFFQRARFLGFFPVIFGVYLTATSFIHFINFRIQRADHIEGSGRSLFIWLFSLAFGLALIFQPRALIGTLRYLSSGFFVLMSLNMLLDLRRELWPQKNVELSDNVKRRIRFQLPTVITAIVPRSAIDKVNETLRIYEKEPEQQDLFKDPDAQFDLEIFIHVAKKLLGMVGHIDLCYNDTVMAFGNYDEASYRLKGVIGSGVLSVIDGKEKYLDFCIRHSEKSIFGFGLKLTETQRKQVESRIANVMDEVDRWLSPIERTPDEPCDDYASTIVQQIGAKLYKFRDGGFRTYFAASTNCALLADKVVGVLGTDIISLNGILTPGAYYNYLDREFRRKNSIVVTKRLYKEQDDEE